MICILKYWSGALWCLNDKLWIKLEVVKCKCSTRNVIEPGITVNLMYSSCVYLLTAHPQLSPHGGRRSNSYSTTIWTSHGTTKIQKVIYFSCITVKSTTLGDRFWYHRLAVCLAWALNPDIMRDQTVVLGLSNNACSPDKYDPSILATLSMPSGLAL